MSAYNPPLELLPIFNPGVFITSLPNGGLTQATADTLYVSLATSQGVPSTKTYSTQQIFNNIAQFATQSAIPGGQAQTIKSNTAPYVARVYNVNPTTDTDLVLPTSSGTIALLSDIPSASTYVTTAGTQTITGTKAFTAGTGISTSGTYPRGSNTNQQTSTFTTPAIQVGGSTNDGIYSSTTDVIDIGTQGTNYVSLQPQGIYRFVGGTIDPAIVFNQRIQAFNGANSATSPGIQIDNQNSGFYRVNQGTIGIGISGVATARWSSAGLNLFGVAGTAAAPAIVMANDTTSGFYRPSANQVGIAISGAQVGNWTSTGLSITGAISATTTINGAAGAVGAPSLYFSTDTTSGLYRPTANQVGIAISGAQVANITSTGIAVTGAVSATTTINGAAGAVGAPSLYLSTDTTSGLYRSAANEVAVSCSGTQRLKVSSTGISTTGISQTSIPMACFMTKSTSQSTATGSAVSVVNYNVSSNPSSYFTLDTTAGTITFTVSDAPAMFLISGQIQFPSSTSGNRGLWIEDGSGQRLVDFNRNATNDAGDTSKSFVSGLKMYTSNATYVLTMKIYQNTGGTINSGGIVSTNLTTFACARIN